MDNYSFSANINTNRYYPRVSCVLGRCSRKETQSVCITSFLVNQSNLREIPKQRLRCTCNDMEMILGIYTDARFSTIEQNLRKCNGKIPFPMANNEPWFMEGSIWRSMKTDSSIYFCMAQWLHHWEKQVAGGAVIAVTLFRFRHYTSLLVYVKRSHVQHEANRK